MLLTVLLALTGCGSTEERRYIVNRADIPGNTANLVCWNKDGSVRDVDALAYFYIHSPAREQGLGEGVFCDFYYHATESEMRKWGFKPEEYVPYSTKKY